MAQLDELTYEEARQELHEVVTKLESGTGSLSESMRLWQKGCELAQICRNWLDGAQRTIEQSLAPQAQEDPED